MRHILESHFKDVQDFEFTIQDGKVLHAANAQRQTHRRRGVEIRLSTWSREKLISTGKRRSNACRPTQLDQLLAPIFDRKSAGKAAKAIAKRSSRPDRARRPDMLYFNADRCGGSAPQKGEKVLLVTHRNLSGRFARHDRGGRNSDRARRRFVARGAGRATDGQGLHLRRVAALNIDYRAKTMTVGNGMSLPRRRRLSFDRRHERRQFTPATVANRAIGNHPGFARRQQSSRKKARPIATSRS